MLQFIGFFNSYSEFFNAEVTVIQKVEYVVIIKKGVNSYQLVLQLFGRHDWSQGLKGDFGFRNGFLKLIDPLFYPSTPYFGTGYARPPSARSWKWFIPFDKLGAGFFTTARMAFLKTQLKVLWTLTPDISGVF